MTTTPAHLSTEQWLLLVAAHSTYGKAAVHYDEVLHEVSARAMQFGSIGKADVGALLFWKRLRADTRWAFQLHITADADVRVHTSRAMERVNDESKSLSEAAGAGRAALSPLPGFVSGDALASAVLLAMAPTRMAVFDRRGQAALHALGIPLTNSRGRYARFIQIIDDLLQNQPTTAQPWSPRDLDMALFQFGGSR